MLVPYDRKKCALLVSQHINPRTYPVFAIVSSRYKISSIRKMHLVTSFDGRRALDRCKSMATDKKIQVAALEKSRQGGER